MNGTNLSKTYSDRSGHFDKLESSEKKSITVISILRLTVFIGGIILTVFAFSLNTLAGIVVLSLAAVLFVYLLVVFQRLSSRAAFYSRMSAINRAEAKAADGDFSSYDGAAEESDEAHDYSSDADIFGRDSLFMMLNRTFTPNGKNRLANWLKFPLQIEGDLKNRQEAVNELSGKLDWRQTFIANGMACSVGSRELDDFIAWLGEDRYFFSSLTLRLALIILPAAAVSVLLLTIAGVVNYTVLIGILLLNLSVVWGRIKTTNRIHRRLSGKQEFLQSLESLVTLLGSENFDSQILKKISNEMNSGHENAGGLMKRLTRISGLFDSRLNMFAGFILNGFLLWDFQCISALEKWKRESAERLPLWLDHIAETEAFISLAGFAYNNPGFIYPVLSDDGTILETVSMGHPMIGRSARVCNDFSLRSRDIFIITGANMSGKSTFLRTVAVNMLLAMSGAPVCAGNMRFSPVRMFTSMRTSDSLSHGESYFYAELKRLRMLKDLIGQGEPVLFLLDEILKGTNSADKSAGSRMFVTKLAGMGATGLVATHDTSLGELEKTLGGSVRNRCFEIEIEGDRILFDYKLRDGITSRMNAALLMKEMGITD
jgi:hypothetical protein